MKLKSLLFAICFSLIGHVFAANIHLNPKADAADKKSVATKRMYPGYCQIEIINESLTDIFVYGTFDDNSTVSFPIYYREYPHYISLFYYTYCHNGMYLEITSPYGTIYSGWTNVNSTVRIVPYLNRGVKSAKAEVC
ncbi:MAG: hypothetical protein HYX60_07140 [Legionella longbeachae]|nr:hypothetical protein [Legionella longbeachae]